MRTNKRRLYESIMKDVAKTVKKHLNESNNEFNEKLYNLLDELDDLYVNINNDEQSYRFICEVIQKLTNQWEDLEAINMIKKCLNEQPQ